MASDDVSSTGRRESWHKFFMRDARLWSTRSTCSKWRVGCVITLDRRSISTGYNGSAPGAEHCCDYWRREWSRLSENENLRCESLEDFLKTLYFRAIHRTWSREYEFHAEHNAILDARKREQSIEGSTLYTTLSPCLECARHILDAGIACVYYETLKDTDGLELLRDAGIFCEQIMLNDSCVAHPRAARFLVE